MVRKVQEQKQKQRRNLIRAVVSSVAVIALCWVVVLTLKANTLAASGFENGKVYIAVKQDGNIDTELEKKIVQQMKLDDGQIVGAERTYQQDFFFPVIDLETAERLGVLDEAKMQNLDEKIPILSVDWQKFPEMQQFWTEEFLQEHFVAVGELPERDMSHVTPVLIDDGSGKVVQFLTERTAQDAGDTEISEETIVEFDSPEQAWEAWEGGKAGVEIFGERMHILMKFKRVELILAVLTGMSVVILIGFVVREWRK